MLNDITIGQYFPGNSLIHRLDPRMKLTLTMLFIVLVFIPRNWIALGCAVLALAVAVGLSRLPVKLLWRSLKPILLIVAFTSVLQIFYVTGGNVLLQLGPVKITTQGLNNAAFIAVRRDADSDASDSHTAELRMPPTYSGTILSRISSGSPA